MGNKSVGLNDFLQMFADELMVSDITAAMCLGKISSAIAKRRIELTMTQKEFANYLQVTQGMVSRWEGGDYNFSVRTLADIAEKLDMELLIDLRKRKEIQIEQIDENWNACQNPEKKEFQERGCRILSFPRSEVYSHMCKNNMCKIYSFEVRKEM